MDAPSLARDTAQTMLAEPPVPAALPRRPYELRIAGLRAHRPDGEVIALGEPDLVVPAGRRVALVARGRTGASALAAVLRGFLAYEGTITLNGVELRDLAGDDVRSVIGLCARDTPILPVTVAGNVRAARPAATDEQVTGAMRRAGLDARADRPVSDVDADARRRIGLARALLAEVPILVLDDPAGPDGGHADDAVLAQLLTAAEDRTLLLVTHRAVVPGATPILRHVDEVITLSDR